MSCSLQGRKESDATERLNNCKATSSGLVSYGHENTDWRKTIFDSLTLLKIFSHEKEKSITFLQQDLQSINFNYVFFSPMKGNLTEISYYKMAKKDINNRMF